MLYMFTDDSTRYMVPKFSTRLFVKIDEEIEDTAYFNLLVINNADPLSVAVFSLKIELLLIIVLPPPST